MATQNNANHICEYLFNTILHKTLSSCFPKVYVTGGAFFSHSNTPSFQLATVTSCFINPQCSITNLYATGTGRGDPPRKLLLSDDGLRLGTGDVWYFVCIVYKL